MKKQFAEYYNLPDERIKEIWDNSLIVLDTNVLLNLYRYNEEARNDFINALKSYEGRLWIPYQVGLEFHRRRETIMRKNAEAYGALGNSISVQLVKAVDVLCNDYSRHPYIDIKDIRKKIERCAVSIKKSLETQSKKHPNYFEKDEILDAVSNLFDGCVGNDFAEDELEVLYKEGERRYANQVPPGYCDEKNKKDKAKRSLYGDLVVWKQVIAYAKEKEQSVIFITDDHKSDWWDKVEGKHTPRKELIKEFMDCTGQNILIYDSGRFLEYAKRNKAKVSAKTIREVAKVKEVDVIDLERVILSCLDPINNDRHTRILRNLAQQVDGIQEQFRKAAKSIPTDFAKGLTQSLQDVQQSIARAQLPDFSSRHFGLPYDGDSFGYRSYFDSITPPTIPSIGTTPHHYDWLLGGNGEQREKQE